MEARLRVRRVADAVGGAAGQMDAAFRSQLLLSREGHAVSDAQCALRPSSASFRSAPLPAPHSPSVDQPNELLTALHES